MMTSFFKVFSNPPTPEHPPFWMDSPSQSLYKVQSHGRMANFLLWYMVGLSSLTVILAPVVFFQFISRWLALGYIGMMIFFSVFVLTRWRVYQAGFKQFETIQDHAKQQLGASLIGSTAHVAGHPQLKRDERVVLALVGNALQIYHFDSFEPVDVLQGLEIDSVKTVVYDDERIPHTDVVDSAAQAIELQLTRNGVEWGCLFHRMFQHRPIDWYHAIESARLRAHQVFPSKEEAPA